MVQEQHIVVGNTSLAFIVYKERFYRGILPDVQFKFSKIRL